MIVIDIFALYVYSVHTYTVCLCIYREHRNRKKPYILRDLRRERQRKERKIKKKSNRATKSFKPKHFSLFCVVLCMCMCKQAISQTYKNHLHARNKNEKH